MLVDFSNTLGEMRWNVRWRRMLWDCKTCRSSEMRWDARCLGYTTTDLGRVAQARSSFCRGKVGSRHQDLDIHRGGRVKQIRMKSSAMWARDYAMCVSSGGGVILCPWSWGFFMYVCTVCMYICMSGWLRPCARGLWGTLWWGVMPIPWLWSCEVGRWCRDCCLLLFKNLGMI